MNKIINTVLISFLKKEKNDYGLMINGLWGCGKIYYVTRELREIALREKYKFIYKKATLQGKHHGRMTFMAGALFFCAVISIILLAFLSDRLLGFYDWPPTLVNIILSMPLLAIGIWLWLWSALAFCFSHFP